MLTVDHGPVATKLAEEAELGRVKQVGGDGRFRLPPKCAFPPPALSVGWLVAVLAGHGPESQRQLTAEPELNR
jgi:hypothetical protein